MDRITEQVIESQHVGNGRRDFLKSTVKGIVAAGTLLTVMEKCSEPVLARTREDRLKRIASNTWAVLPLFKQRPRRQPPQMNEEQKNRWMQRQQENDQWKKKYGEITLLDFPQFTKDTYPGVANMDLFNGLFGDISDDSQFVHRQIDGESRPGDFDPSAVASKGYLDKLVNKMVSTGVYVRHISNNAPRNIADLDDEKRREGIRVAKNWLDAAKHIGAKSMRVNTGGPQIIPAAEIKDGYPQNIQVVPYLKKAIESFKEMAEYGEKVGVKVTIENHWGLAANPLNIRIIINEVNNPFCEASPDFCNWEHEYMLYHSLEVLVPLATSMIHAKRWTRFPDVDIARCVRILDNANYHGYISIEYEAGGDPVQGSIKLLEDVVAAMV
ncbi:MAG: sugar phosphate isomerase/epimerase [Patescibacteria group bacterium]|nr:sugar phosphate isomerase/epimerase [Patescibacteria group bacterium]